MKLIRALEKSTAAGIDAFVCQTSFGEVSVKEATLHAARVDGRSLDKIGLECGLIGLRSLRYPKSKPPGIATILAAFLEMGYEIDIRRPNL